MNNMNFENEVDEKLEKERMRELAILHALAMEDKYERDRITGLQEATERGRKEGIEIGRKEGIEIGRKKGIEIEIAKRMLNKKMDIELISELTGLTIEEITKLKI